MVVTLLVIVVFVALRAVSRTQPDIKPQAVDYLTVASAAREAGHRVVYPAALPRGWMATSVEFVPGEPPGLGLGMLTAAAAVRRRAPGGRAARRPADDLRRQDPGKGRQDPGRRARWPRPGRVRRQRAATTRYVAPRSATTRCWSTARPPSPTCAAIVGLLTDARPLTPADGGRGQLLLGASRRGVEPLPGAVEPVLADLGELLAALPERERLLEGGAAGLEPADDLDQLLAGLLVGRSARSASGSSVLLVGS